MSQKSGKQGVKFLIWVMANFIGFGAMGGLLLLFPSIMEVSGTLVITLILIPIGFCQWFVLRRIMQISILWIFTIPIGLLLGVLLNKILPVGLSQVVDDESIAALTFGYVVMGFTIGLPQWLILRRQKSHSSVWLLGSTIGAAGGFWLILVTDLISISGIISYIVVVLVYTIVTGLILTRLLAYQNQ